MKLVDILFVLTVAVTTNAILIPFKKDGLPHASSTSSQVSSPTNDPDLDTFDQDWQEVIDAIDLSIFNQDQHQPVDEPSSGTSSQVSGSTNEPVPEIPDKDWQEIMDIINSKKPNQDQQQPINQHSSSTLRQSRKRQMNQHIPNTPNEYWKLIMNEIGSRTREDWQKTIDAVISKVYNQDQQQPIDELGPSTSKQDWKAMIDKPDPGIPKNWRDLIDQVNSINSNQDQQLPMDQPGPSTSKRGRKRLIDRVSPSTSSQAQQQPIDQDRSANTVTNQVAGLNGRYRETFNRIEKKLAAFTVIKKKKLKAYRRYVNSEFKQQPATSQKISELQYILEAKSRLKQEYITARNKVNDIRQQLKRFMKRHALDFEEPESDSDSD
ncbi:hypothetical protein QVD99_005186 [Batrachochytrium dendrobatidis]|nr:hypothetical protein QVD99_005186 [Batrachochytrium dendrobatidis]